MAGLIAPTHEEEEYSEEESEEEEEEDAEEEIPTKEVRKDAVYNTVGLHEKLEEIGWPDNVEWIEKLCVEYKREQEIDSNDDLAREMAFYTQALEGTREAYEKLQGMGIPFLRPTDYYAQMVKTDTHMLKVKDKLLFQKKKMEEADERRKAREAKKLSKAIQAEKLKERAKQKKHDIESVKKWRKMRQNSGYAAGADEMPLDLEAGYAARNPNKGFRRGVAPGDRSGGKAAPGDRSGGKANQGRGPLKGGRQDGTGKGGNFKKTREFRNAKFGYGGRKRSSKQNTAESAADVSGFKGERRENKRRRNK